MQRMGIAWLVLLFLVSCRLDDLAASQPNPTLIAEPQSPEEVVRRTLTLFHRQPLPVPFEVLTTHPVPGTDNVVLVLYRYQRATGVDSSTVPALGIQVAERQGQFWKAGDCSTSFNTSIAAPGSQVIYLPCPFSSGNQTYLALYGQVLSPDVAVVEITPTVEEGLRATVANSAFVLVVPSAHTAQDLRLLDANDQVLRRCPVPPSPPMPEAGGAVASAPIEC